MAAPSKGAGGGGVLQLVRTVLQKYDELLQRNPVMTKAVTSCVGFAIGDRLAQSVVGGWGVYDPWRGLRLSLYGLLIDGPVGHAWYKVRRAGRPGLRCPACGARPWVPALICPT